MVRIKGINDGERKRRIAQSKRDKAKAKPARKALVKRPASNRDGGPRGNNRKLASSTKDLHPYTKLILDPCQATLTKSPAPGREGSSVFRLPYRFVVTLPTSTKNIQGAGISGGYDQTNLQVCLAPSALSATVKGTGGIAAISVACNGTESVAPRTPAQIASGTNGNDYYLNTDPVGLLQLNNISSLIRPIAGCVKLEFYSGQNQGNFYGYEGVTGDLYYRYPNDAAPSAFVPNTSGSVLAMQGWTNSLVTQGAEAAVNYAASVPQWTEFKQIGNQTVTGSPDAADSDISQMPIAIVGVGGAIPGTQYLVSGAIVYEWSPAITFGVSGAGAGRPEVRNEKAQSTVISQLAKYGPMLVGVASSLATGGPSLAISDLLYKLSLNRNNTTNERTRGGWG